MCLSDDAASPHSCFSECPLCWTMTIDTFSGEEICLHSFDLFTKTADLGCRMCKYVVAKAAEHKPTYVATMSPDITVSMRAVHGQGRSSGIQNIEFVFVAPTDPFARPGVIEISKHRWWISVGIHSIDPQIQAIFPRQPADPSMSSEVYFQAIREHVSNCSVNHKACYGNHTTLPSRLICVGTETDITVHVELNANHEQGQYLALSYCWGDTEQLELTKSTLDAFTKSGINIATLPQTIKDAVIVTRRLGFSYLWIDALCILQDDDDDKLEIIANMANIYKNAAITISAASTLNSSEGFLHPRKEILDQTTDIARLPLRERLTWPLDLSVKEVPLGELRLCHWAMGYEVKDFSDDHINTRAWTLQETWLSRRLLIFGSTYPQWRCLEEEIVIGPVDQLIFDRRPPRRDMNRQIYHGMRSRNIDGDLHADQERSYSTLERERTLKGRREFLTAVVAERTGRPSQASLWQWWRDILQEYNGRALTYREDRMLALSGLASEFHKHLDDQYLSGLWRSSLPWALLWRRTTSTYLKGLLKEDKPPALRLNRWRWLLGRWPESEMPEGDHHFFNPTWSPLASFFEVFFETRSNHIESGPGTSLVTIHGVVNKLRSEAAPFGECLISYIELTGPMCKMSWSEVTSRFVIPNDAQHEFWDYIMVDHPSQFLSICKTHEPSPNDQYNVTQLTRMFEWRFGDPSAEILATLPPRPTPPEAEDPLPDVMVEDEDPTMYEPNRLEFWFLEITHTHTPSGLFLKRNGWNSFVRLGYFHMGRGICPDKNPVTFQPDVGRRSWDWDSMLKMRRIYLL